MPLADLVAHTPPLGTQQWHSLASHLHGTSKLAAEFAGPFGGGTLASWVGLGHDLGKAHPAWQAYLREAHRLGLDRRASRKLRKPDHRLAGAFLAIEQGVPVLAAAILGHHGGMPARDELQRLKANGKSDAQVTEVLPLLQEHFAEIATSAPGADAFPAWARQPGSMEAFGRLLFSCLVDADYLDTEAHFLQQPRERAPLLDAPRSMRLLQAYRTTLSSKASPMDRVREEVFDRAVAAAKASPGFFRLAAPTGSGKTLAALGFALTHATLHGHRRIIVALPYTTIIDQTARVYRSALEGPVTEGGPTVLEHHSALEPPDDDDEPAAMRLRLATENWDAPVVVTTTVQLFESLFSNRPGRCRKLHNVARSVIILDEVQTLPVPLLEPTLAMLRELVEHYGVTVVLSTATQPALEGSTPFLRGIPPESVRDIVADPAATFAALRRVDYEIHTVPSTWVQIASGMRTARQTMAIVNTRRQAVDLLDALEDPPALHLSTYLCGRHRMRVLEEARARLRENEPCRLVSTQVVEAGVDIDFPVVMRAVGPLDRIVQAAGRCNREGKVARGRVVVFQPEEDAVPRGVYASATELARGMLADGVDLHDPATFEAYFRAVYRHNSTDRWGVEALRKSFDYPAVADAYRLIREDTVSVVVPYEDAAAVLARAEQAPPRQGLRMLQPFTVTIQRREQDRFEVGGLVRERPSGILEWTGDYDARVGIGRFTSDPLGLVVG